MSLCMSREPSARPDPHAPAWEPRVPAGASDQPLPAAKFAPPLPPPAELDRPRLTVRLQPDSLLQAALLVAPAAAGKSTLVRQWCREQADRSTNSRAQRSEVRKPGTPVAWLTIDEEDNDPARFLRSLCAALEPAVPEAAAPACALLESTGTASFQHVLLLLLEGLGALPERAALVLDAYHSIEARAVHDLVTTLLEHLPPSLFLILATRSDPPLPFARLRREGQLIEIRNADLRFSEEEAAAYLNERMGLRLTPESVARLNRRTEGWIAALQAAALSLQGEADPSDFLDAFTSRRRYLVDHLFEHALQRQPPAVQEFLSRTAFLDRVNSSLCYAVTGFRSADAMLQRLAASGLFLVPLDSQGRWFGFAPLFADVLHAWSLSQCREALAPLRKRAAAWCEQEGKAGERRFLSSEAQLS